MCFKKKKKGSQLTLNQELVKEFKMQEYYVVSKLVCSKLERVRPMRFNILHH